MPFYPFNEELTLGAILREGLNDLRDARYKLAHVQGVLVQMSDAQVQSEFGFASEAVAGTAKAELLSGIGFLLANDSGLTTAQAYAAVVQMLNQFG